MRRFIVCLLVMFTVCLCVSPVRAFDKHVAAKKIKRGVKSFFTSPKHLFTKPIEYTKKHDNAVVGATSGFVAGVDSMLTDVVGGFVDVVTFPFDEGEY